jgi:acyl-CoA synthetase (AMP-forming)/AMP-acid ligase II
MLHDRSALGRWLADASRLDRKYIHGIGGAVALAQMRQGTSLGAERAALDGRSVLLLTDRQEAAALALIELDGLVRRIVIAPPDLRLSDIGRVLADADVDTILTDRPPADLEGLDLPPLMACGLALRPAEGTLGGERATEWILLTSGTTGAPKMVIHSRSALTAAIKPMPPRERPPVWATFYDIRRYGGLQIFFRAMLGEGSLVLSCAGEAVADHLERLAAHGVSHISGTPSHWRRALMSQASTTLAPDYVRLSGEIADQAVLDSLHRAFPKAQIGHAYASTEAGVGFEVVDGREGFPANFLGRRGDVEMKIEAGSLRIRSTRTASAYMATGTAVPSLADIEGFVDTDDMVEQRGERCYFVGRRSGIINVGGLKVHPEEVEAVINRHARVRMSLVKARNNPITGAVVVADVVLRDAAVDETAAPEGGAPAVVKDEILHLCRTSLAYHKVPVLLRFVPTIAVSPAGKLSRSHA